MKRFFTALLLAGLAGAAACQQHEQPGQGDSPQEHDGVIPVGAIPAPPRETQPGLGQDASPEPASDTTQVTPAAANAVDTAGTAQGQVQSPAQQGQTPR